MRTISIIPLFLVCLALTLSSCSLLGKDDATSGWKTYNVKSQNFSFMHPKDFKILDEIDNEEGALYLDNKEIDKSEEGTIHAPIVMRRAGSKTGQQEITRLQNKDTSDRIIDGKKVQYLSGTFRDNGQTNGNRKEWEKPKKGYIIVITNPDIIISGTVEEEAGFNVENTLNEILESMDFQ